MKKLVKLPLTDTYVDVDNIKSVSLVTEFRLYVIKVRYTDGTWSDCNTGENKDDAQRWLSDFIGKVNNY